MSAFREASAGVLILLVSAATPVVATAQPPAVEDPKTMDVFRVNSVSGALMPLESVAVAPEHHGWMFKNCLFYVAGAASPVASHPARSRPSPSACLVRRNWKKNRSGRLGASKGWP